MNSFDDTRRQLRFALISLAIIFPIGIIGYMIIEDMSFADAFWLTVITLGTIGYGDVVPSPGVGRFFTVFLIIFGLGSVALAAQAAVVFFVSPQIRSIRIRRRADRKIRSMRNHYVICGEGEMVDQTIRYLLKRAELRREHQREALEAIVDRRLWWLPGNGHNGLLSQFRHLCSRLMLWLTMQMHRGETLLDVIVVITKDPVYAQHLIDNQILVIEDDATDDVALRRAGVGHALALMSMLDDDTENLLTVLTVRELNPAIYITAGIQEDSLSLKMVRVGANNVLAPYEVAGQFLNNATLRPAVNDFFSSILFDQDAQYQMVQLYLGDKSPWIGNSIGSLHLREQFDTAIIGVRHEDGSYIYAPDNGYIIQVDDVLLSITPGRQIARLQQHATVGSIAAGRGALWQPFPTQRIILKSEHTYSLMEAENAIGKLARHYIICGSGPVAQAALDNLDPERPFVVLSDDPSHTSEMISRGFRVVNGDPTLDTTLARAGVDRALAIMISMEDKADNLLTVLNCRTMNKNLLITVTANTDDMISKLRRAGADRVVSPYRIAAQFVLLATTRPSVSDFLQYVLFNYPARIETTELYIQNTSPWIGKRIGDLNLEKSFHAGAIGVRLNNGQFLYAPASDYILREGEVLIVITSMDTSDELRLTAHGGGSLRPESLRR